MLEVGNMATLEEDRSHFGAWVIVSSPLILGYDVANRSLTRKVWPIISNVEAIAVNQQWAGHPGRLIRAWNLNPTPPSGDTDSYAVGFPCNRSDSAQLGFSYNPATKQVERTAPGSSSSAAAKRCLQEVTSGEAEQPMDVDLRLLPCASGSAGGSMVDKAVDKWVMAANGELQAEARPSLCADIFCGPCHAGGPLQLAPCHNGTNQEFTFEARQMKAKIGGASGCITAVTSPAADPADRGDIIKTRPFSLWAKKQPNGSQAVFVLSNPETNSSGGGSSSDGDGGSFVLFTFGEIGFAASETCTVRDIWARKTLGRFEGSFTTPKIGGHGSHFYLISDCAAAAAVTLPVSLLELDGGGPTQ
jgi:hypothetical protein